MHTIKGATHVYVCTVDTHAIGELYVCNTHITLYLYNKENEKKKIKILDRYVCVIFCFETEFLPIAML